MKNNKGYTLIELIVSTAIFAIISLAIASFLITGSRMYSNINYSIKLQYESQLIMNQLNEYLVDCDSAVVWEGNTLYVVTEDTVHIFEHRFDDTEDSDNTIYYGNTTPPSNTTPSAGMMSLMAEHVTDMDIAFKASSDGDGANQIAVTLTLKRNNKSYQAEHIVALRNHPAFGNNWSEVFPNRK